MTPLRTGALLMLIVPSILRAEWRTPVQAYLASGIENGDNYYFGAGLEGFNASEEVLYILGCSFVRIIDNRDIAVTGDGTPPGPPAEAPLSAESRYSATRLTVNNRVDFSFAPGWSAGATLNGSAEPWMLRIVDATPGARFPAPPPRTGAILSQVSSTRWTVVVGGEISRDVDGLRAGAGALRITDFEETHITQVYGFASSNQRRTTYALIRAGGVFGERFLFDAKVMAHVEVSSEVALTAALSYGRTSFVYDLEDRYLNFYRETDSWRGDVTAAYDASASVRVFARCGYETNDRFSMGLAVLGVYLHP